MKRSVLLILLVMLIGAVVPVASAGASNGALFTGHTLPASEYPGGTFFDDDTSIFENEIEALAAKGVTRGCNAERTSFCPNDRVTRGQMAAFLVRALALTDLDPTIDFDDDDDSIFEADIERLATAGITKGCGSGNTFCPNDSVTRGQMAAFLVRALKLTDLDPTIDFDDDDDSIFEADIERLATAGITKGCGSGNTFCPNDSVTRGQMAAFLSRALKYELPLIADRDSTIDGILIDVSDEFVAAGCDIPETWTTCSVALTVPQGKFHVWEYWWLDDWSIRTAAEKADFLSDDVRTEVYFNGARLDTFEINQLEQDSMFKDTTFQFYEWLEGTHTLQIIYVDDAFQNTRQTLTITLTIDSSLASVSSLTTERPVPDLRPEALSR